MSDWNRIWQEGDAYDTPAVRAMFVDAINERLISLRVPPDSYPLAFPTIASGTPSRKDVTRSLDSPEFERNYGRCNTLRYVTGLQQFGPAASPVLPTWYAMQMVVNWMADQFVDPAVVRTGYRGINYLADVYDYFTYFQGSAQSPVETGFGTFSQLRHQISQLPAAGGMRRKREREITRLSAGGTNGQRARFIYASSAWVTDGPYSLHTNPSPDQPASLPAEIGNSLKMFDRIGGVWQLSLDQATPADEVTLYGLARPGDEFAPHILNDLRDALNRMTLSLASCSPVPADASFTALRCRQRLGQAFNGDTAEANAEFDSAATSQPSHPCCFSVVIPTFSASLSLQSSEAYYYVRLSTHCARTVQFFYSAVAGSPNSQTVQQTGGNDGRTFDAFGSGVTISAGNWPQTQLLSTTSNTTAEYVVSAKIGNADTKPSLGPLGTPSNHGWSIAGGVVNPVGTSFAIVDWAVPGGYACTAAT